MSILSIIYLCISIYPIYLSIYVYLSIVYYLETYWQRVHVFFKFIYLSYLLSILSIIYLCISIYCLYIWKHIGREAMCSVSLSIYVYPIYYLSMFIYPIYLYLSYISISIVSIYIYLYIYSLYNWKQKNQVIKVKYVKNCQKYPISTSN